MLVPPRTANTQVAAASPNTPSPAPGAANASVVSQIQQQRPLGGGLQGAVQGMLSGRRTFGTAPRVGATPGPLRANFAMRPPQMDMQQPRPRPMRMAGPLQ